MDFSGFLHRLFESLYFVPSFVSQPDIRNTDHIWIFLFIESMTAGFIQPLPIGTLVGFLPLY